MLTCIFVYCIFVIPTTKKGEQMKDKYLEKYYLNCERCGYKWLPRSLKTKPKVCPQCNSRIWFKKKDK